MSANGAFTKALLAVQAEMPAIDRDGENPHFKSRFTTLGNLITKVKPVLNKHGIAFAQFPASDEHGNPTLVTVLMHESGERLEYAAPLVLTKQDPQGQGSAITYMRRYALAAALGISDQDDDGNGASPPPEGNGSSIGKTIAKQLVDRAWAVVDAKKNIRLAASHAAGGRDVGDCSTKVKATEAIASLTFEQAQQLERRIAEKEKAKAAKGGKDV